MTFIQRSASTLHLSVECPRCREIANWRRAIRTCIHEETDLSAVRTVATNAIPGDVECTATFDTGCCRCRTRRNDYRLRRRYSTECLGELLDLCDDRVDLAVAQQVVEVRHCTGLKAVRDDLPQVFVGRRLPGRSRFVFEQPEPEIARPRNQGRRRRSVSARPSGPWQTPHLCA